MALNLKSPEVVAQVRRLAKLRQLDLTEAVMVAVTHELKRDEESRNARLRRMRAIATRVASMPVLDKRSSDEILGYNDAGLPS